MHCEILLIWDPGIMKIHLIKIKAIYYYIVYANNNKAFSSIWIYCPKICFFWRKKKTYIMEISICPEIWYDKKCAISKHISVHSTVIENYTEKIIALIYLLTLQSIQ